MGAIKSKVITSAAAGTVNIAAAPGTGKHLELHGFLVGLATTGTLKFVSDAAGTPVELMGAIPVLAGVVPPAAKLPVGLPAGSNKTLDLVSVTGVTAGVVFYSIEDD